MATWEEDETTGVAVGALVEVAVEVAVGVLVGTGVRAVVGALVGGALVEMAVGLPFFVAAALNLVAIVLAASFFRLAHRREIIT